MGRRDLDVLARFEEDSDVLGDDLLRTGERLAERTLGHGGQSSRARDPCVAGRDPEEGVRAGPDDRQRVEIGSG